MAIPFPGFVLVFPCYAIESESCSGPFVRRFDDGRIAIILLTDDDLLERYRRQHGLHGATIQFDDEPQLVLYLDDMPTNITHIIIDPGEKSIFTASIADFFRKFLSQFGDSDS